MLAPASQWTSVHRLVCRSLLALVGACSVAAAADDSPVGKVIEGRLVHLRNRPEREWSDFPEMAEAARWSVTFAGTKNSGEHSLVLRQQDVKQAWSVTLNGTRLSELVRDENDMTIGLAVAANVLKEGDNVLVVESPASSKATDDVRVGQIRWHNRPVNDVLSEATLQVSVTGDAGEPLPSRVTVIDEHGSLVQFGTLSSQELAIRPGTAYTSSGRATLALPAGKHTVFAGRGFEYSLARAEFTVTAGQTHQQQLSIRREVPTDGFVACDTHVHTLTFSGHGDATIAERMITLAAEAIELPIATDHNRHVDYEAFARMAGVRKYFTPVIGNEVTTPRGHFNIFPVRGDVRLPDHRQTDWGLLLDDIHRTPGVKVAILNHARDLHSGVRPFAPSLHNALVGENLEGWPLRFQGMEVINSGATQTDPLQLLHDWMGLLNHGYPVTPVGASDSHDVARHFVGQGRTYIRCDDRDPGNLDVEAAVNSFLQGRVMVSYGLLAELTVNGKYSSGELACAPDDDVQIQVRVLGPHWVQADQVLLFSNGTLLREEQIKPADRDPSVPGVVWSGSWTIPRPRHDVHLVAIAAGPGVDGPHWRTAKPYQPTSPEARTRVLGCSGAVWLDADRDGRRSAARDYAGRLLAASRGDVPTLIASLSEFDAACAAQAAHLLRMSGTSLQDDAVQTVLKSAAPAVRSGFQQYQLAWRENEIARGNR